MDDTRLVRLNAQQRVALEQLLARTKDARSYRRVMAILKIAANESPELVAEALGVGRASVYRWIERYNTRMHGEDLLEQRRSGRPSKLRSLSETALEHLLSRSPEDFGYRATTWTVALLCTHIAQEYGIHVSDEAMRQRLHRQNYRWKRPRYVYHETDPRKGQKKGASFQP
ncbi:MAG TPA: winged helix-turn-helix domain-containing protein [Candidatus Paceibacterota bacterium]|nr:winged helix-turn-helix domain-containing protein [Candidatus Paceibacterota bacterium]